MCYACSNYNEPAYWFCMHNYVTSACTIMIALHAKSQYLCMQHHNISACLRENSIPACCWPHTWKTFVIMQICCYYADMLLSCISQKRNLQCMQEYCHHAQHYNLHFDHTISACMVMTYLYDDKNCACITTAPLHNHNMRCSEALLNPEPAL